MHLVKCLSISFQALGPQLFVSLSVVSDFIVVNSHMSMLSGLAWSTCCTAVDGAVSPKGPVLRPQEAFSQHSVKRTLVNISKFYPDVLLFELSFACITKQPGSAFVAQLAARRSWQ